MNKLLFTQAKIRLTAKVLFIGLSFIFALNCGIAETFAQKAKKKPLPAKTTSKKTTSIKTVPTVAVNLPKVTQIDTVALKNLVKRNGENQKPLVVNFWATWCGPCVEEFPDLVKIDEEYRGKIDFITISMDDLADINTEVPKFLGKMNAKMPAYLLKTNDEEDAINAVTKDWEGGLPFTIIYNPKGEIFYIKQGKVKPVDLRKEIDKVTVLARIRNLEHNQSLITTSINVLETRLNLIDIRDLPTVNRRQIQEKFGDKNLKISALK